MPDKRSHRGPNPEDLDDFSPAARPRLSEAATDLSWLLSRGYSQRAAVKLVGDKFALTERQRLAVQRCVSPDDALRRRRAREISAAGVAGKPIWIDGFSVLTTVEAALAGGFVLVGCDGCLRDMASIHGHYKRVEETLPAIDRVGSTLECLRVSEAVWYLDRPVANSGRLRGWLADAAALHGWRWRTELVRNPDAVLVTASEIVATADSMILDRCARWFNLVAEVIRKNVPNARLVEFAAPLRDDAAIPLA